MHPDIIGYGFQYQWFEHCDPMIEKRALMTHNAFRYFVNGFLPLIDALDEPQRRFDFVLYVIDGLFGYTVFVFHHFPVKRVDPESWNSFIIQNHLVIAVHFYHVHIRIHILRFRGAVFGARQRIKVLYDIDPLLYFGQWTFQALRKLLIVVVTQKFQMITDDGFHRSICESIMLNLNQQAFFQIARSDADRIQVLNEFQSCLDILWLIIAGLCDVFQRRFQITVFIKIPDDFMDNPKYRLLRRGEPELPLQVIGKRSWSYERVLEGWIFYGFALCKGRVTQIEIIAKESFIIESIFYLIFFCPLRLGILVRLLHFGLGVIFLFFHFRSLFLQNRIRLHFLREVVCEFESCEW